KYNAEGRRVEKDVNGVKTRFLYEGDKITLEVNESGEELARNIYGTNLIQRKASGQIYNYLYNGHADVTTLIDPSGAIAASYYYDAFGNILEESGTVQNPYRYAGYEYDKETKQYYLKSRYYDPKIARFLSEDSYRGDRKDPLSLNLYTYCHNEPIMYTDPDGHREAVGAVYADEKRAKKNETKKNMYTKHKAAKPNTTSKSGSSTKPKDSGNKKNTKKKPAEVNKKKETNEVNVTTKGAISVKTKENGINSKALNSGKKALLSNARNATLDKVGEHIIDKVPEYTTLGKITKNLPNRNARRAVISKFGKGVTTETIVPRIGVKSLKTVGKVGVVSALLAVPEIVDNFKNYKHPVLRTGVTVAATIAGVIIGAATVGAATPVVVAGAILALAIGVGASMVNDVFLGQKKH
ncbi:RHS repeat-associated core domain-containing protein, partial [Fervidicella metallireducens]|uniref:RHS repeat-associated core domain-containing protein n=1 Tax=Fervidicella metallireducens TaxID=655338 RepID=UPI000557C874